METFLLVSPFGIDPALVDVIVFGSAWLLAFICRSREAFLFVSVVAVVRFAQYGWLIFGAGRSLSTRKGTPRLEPPDVIVFVPGLGMPAMFGPLLKWVYLHGSNARWITVDVPKEAHVFFNLGTDLYVERVLEAIPDDGQRIALLGSSRGAGVVLRTTLEAKPEVLARIHSVVMLNGPFIHARDVLIHRLGKEAGLAAWDRTAAHTKPHDLAETYKMPSHGTPLPPLCFITSEADNVIPHEAVEWTSRKFNGRMLKLKHAPHSLILASYADKSAVQDFIAAL